MVADGLGYGAEFGRVDTMTPPYYQDDLTTGRLDAPTAPNTPRTANVAIYVRCDCLACTQDRHPAGKPRHGRHVVTIRLLTTGWKRWRAECVCGWRSRSNSTRLVAEQFGAEHFRPVTPRGGDGAFRVRLERDELDGGWIAECLELPGCMSQGETQEEALRNISDAISEVIAVPVTSGGGPE